MSGISGSDRGARAQSPKGVCACYPTLAARLQSGMADRGEREYVVGSEQDRKRLYYGNCLILQWVAVFPRFGLSIRCDIPTFCPHQHP